MPNQADHEREHQDDDKPQPDPITNGLWSQRRRSAVLPNPKGSLNRGKANKKSEYSQEFSHADGEYSDRVTLS